MDWVTYNPKSHQGALLATFYQCKCKKNFFPCIINTIPIANFMILFQSEMWEAGQAESQSKTPPESVDYGIFPM